MIEFEYSKIQKIYPNLTCHTSPIYIDVDDLRSDY